MRVEVVAQARLHFGFVDPSGTGARRFGGLGMAIAEPRFLARVEPAPTLIVEGDDTDRVVAMAAHFCGEAGLRPRALIRVLETIPAHVGLGSGTQIALAVAASLARFHSLDLPPETLCRMMGRARRSGVGFHLFQRGGLVIDAGHDGGDIADSAPPAAGHPSVAAVPPLAMRHEVPESWRVVLAVPPCEPSISGEREEEAFRKMGPLPPGTTEKIERLVLDRISPALAAGDLDRFGAALAEIQDLVGGCFAPVQGGSFHAATAPIVEHLRAAGAAGAGQSSWGPAAYGFAGSEAAAGRLRSSLEAVMPQATIRVVRPCNAGAVISLF